MSMMARASSSRSGGSAGGRRRDGRKSRGIRMNWPQSKDGGARRPQAPKPAARNRHKRGLSQTARAAARPAELTGACGAFSGPCCQDASSPSLFSLPR